MEIPGKNIVSPLSTSRRAGVMRTAFLAAGLLTFAAPAFSAQWNGGTNLSWATTANWADTALPSGAVTYAGSSTTGTQTLDGSYTLTSIDNSGSVGPLVINAGTGGTLTFNTNAVTTLKSNASSGAAPQLTLGSGVAINFGSGVTSTVWTVGARTLNVNATTSLTNASSAGVALALTSVGNVSINVGGALTGLGSVTAGGATSGASINLTGVNTYTGGTTVNSGAFAIGSTGAINVGASGVVLNNGAVMTVTGTLNLTAANAGIVNNTGGSIIFGGGAKLNLNGYFDSFNGGASGAYTLISGVGANSGAITSGNITGYNTSLWSGVTYSGGVLNFTAVPEPSTYGLLGAGALAAAALVRRRRKA